MLDSDFYRGVNTEKNLKIIHPPEKQKRAGITKKSARNPKYVHFN